MSSLKVLNKQIILKAWIELGQPLLTDDSDTNREICLSVRQRTGCGILEIRRALQEFCGSQYNPIILKARAVEQYCSALERDISALQHQVDDKRRDMNKDVYYWVLENRPRWLTNMVQQEPNFSSEFDEQHKHIKVLVKKNIPGNCTDWCNYFIKFDDLLK